MAIDPTARVADGAHVGDHVEIGPNCIVGPNVTLGNGVRLIANVHITGVTTIGDNSVVYPFASLGTPPQSVHYHGGPTRLEIGPRCEVRENVTVNTGTEGGGGVTTIGTDCLLMVGTHVGHDCHVGNHVTFANLATLGGHVTIGDNTFLGGMCAVHQFSRIGEGAMIGGNTGVRTDIIPFALASGQHAALHGLNVVGLRRRNVSRTQMHLLRRAYRMLFFGDGVLADRLQLVERQFADEPMVMKIISFVGMPRKRPLMQPDRGQSNARADDAE